MGNEYESMPDRILRPILEAIDELRIALDRAVEDNNHKAAAVLLNSILDLAAVLHEIQCDAAGKPIELPINGGWSWFAQNTKDVC